MNPFPDDATVTIDFATDEGTRQTLRFQNFVVPGRSVVGAYVDEDVTRKSQVSAQVEVGSGRVVVDRIQTFDGTNPALEGITLGLGAPVPAEVWVFPAGTVGEGSHRADRRVQPDRRGGGGGGGGPPRRPGHERRAGALRGDGGAAPLRDRRPPRARPRGDAGHPQRIPDGVGHSIILRSLNGVPVAAENVLTRSEPQDNVGVGVTLGVAARRAYAGCWRRVA